MKIKVFKIRISDVFLAADQTVINNFLSQYEIVHTNSKLIEEDISYWSVLVSYEDKKTNAGAGKAVSISEDELSPEETIIYNRLKNWRSEKAREFQLPSYVIFHNAHLMSIAKHKPNNLEDLQQINGLGKSKIEKYGPEIIEVLENA